MSKFKVGDKVKVLVDIYECSGIPRGSVLDVVERVEKEGYWITPQTVKADVANEYSEEFELAEQVSQTSNKKPPFVSFFTSVIVAKNKDVSDIGEFLYDKNTTRISLEDEGDGVLLLVEQYYDGAIQQIRLDIDEVDTVFSAIKQLVKQTGVVDDGNA